MANKKFTSYTIHTNEELKELQSYDLQKKIALSKARIIEWYETHNGNVYISFSGGKDSTVLLDIVRSVYPDVPAVFVDTGLEFPEIKKFAKSFDNVTLVRPKMNFKEVLAKYGYPLISKEVSSAIFTARRTPNGKTAEKFIPNNFHDQKYGNRYSMVKWNWLKDSDIPISHMCCYVMKKSPAKQYGKESGRVPYIGSMASESLQRKEAWLHHGCNAYDIQSQSSQPLAFWTEQDILQYLAENKLSYASVYGEIKQDKKGKYYTTGRSRTGCVFCGFGCHLEKEPNRFQMLKQTHPQLWEYCMKPTEDGGLGMKKVLDFINVKTE